MPTGRLAVVSLRVSRFFPEPPIRLAINRLYRGLDVKDAAQAHALALKVPIDGFEVFNISARSPFSRDDLKELRKNAKAAI
jgi:UDP-glucose 4-epimerase